MKITDGPGSAYGIALGVLPVHIKHMCQAARLCAAPRRTSPIGPYRPAARSKDMLAVLCLAENRPTALLAFGSCICWTASLRN